MKVNLNVPGVISSSFETDESYSKSELLDKVQEFIASLVKSPVPQQWNIVVVNTPRNLLSVNSKWIEWIKTWRTFTGDGLKEAKDISEAAPGAVLLRGIVSKDEVLKLLNQFGTVVKAIKT